MGQDMDDIAGVKARILGQVADAADESALESLRVAAVGKKGEVSLMMRGLGKMTPEEKQVAGPALNALKNEINSALIARKAALGDAALEERLRSEWLDVTQPSRPRQQGTIHPISQVTEEITAIFADLGYGVAEGPQIENDFYNFDALNIPPEHPARQEFDTFYMHRAEGDNRPPHVLRTHTSPVQIRHMEKHGVPCRIIAPGVPLAPSRLRLDTDHGPLRHVRRWFASGSIRSVRQLVLRLAPNRWPQRLPSPRQQLRQFLMRVPQEIRCLS